MSGDEMIELRQIPALRVVTAVTAACLLFCAVADLVPLAVDPGTACAGILALPGPSASVTSEPVVRLERPSERPDSPRAPPLPA
jgi:hypothetical protein